MHLSPGARLGAYDIVALIGEGGMGEVYRARDTRLARDVALKVIGDGFVTATGNADLEIEEYAPAPDGSKFLFRQFVGEMQLRKGVVTNWPGLLRQ